VTAAYRMRGLGWFLAVVVVVLGFYLVSLQVASERKHLDDVNRAIAQTQRQIRGLDTEFDTRANLAQLERWNGNVLALSAPTAGQFLPGETQLALVDFRNGGEQLAAAHANYIVPSLPVDADRSVVPVAPPGPSPVPSIIPVVARATPLNVPRAVMTAALKQPSVVGQGRPAAIAASATVAVTPARHPRAVAMLDRKRVQDATLSDLLSRADISTGNAR